MGEVTYRDYAWTKKAPDLFYGFCLTFIRNATVPEVIDALPTVGHPDQCDLTTLLSRSLESWEEIGSSNLLVGLVQHGDWRLGHHVRKQRLHRREARTDATTFGRPRHRGPPW